MKYEIGSFYEVKCGFRLPLWSVHKAGMSAPIKLLPQSSWFILIKVEQNNTIVLIEDGTFWSCYKNHVSENAKKL